MFFRKRREAEQKSELDAARKELDRWRQGLADVQLLTDAGEKYFRLQALDKGAAAALGYPVVRDAAEAVTPAARKSVWRWEAVGATGIAGGALLCLAGGPLGLAAGGTAIIYGMLGCIAGGDRAVKNSRNAAIYRANEDLIDGLRALRQDIGDRRDETFRDMEAHPEKIAQSARCDELLASPKLRDAFTAAARTRLKDQEPSKPAKPGTGPGFSL